MKKINYIEKIALNIELLEQRCSNEKSLMIEEAKRTFESVQPINLLKKSLNQLTPLDIKNNALNLGISLLAGYASKKAVLGSAPNPVNKIMGAILQLMVTKLVSSNAVNIRNNASKIINSLAQKFSKKEKQTENNT